jgi:hypothetical protein
MKSIIKKIVTTTCFGVMVGLAVFGIKNNNDSHPRNKSEINVFTGFLLSMIKQLSNLYLHYQSKKRTPQPNLKSCFAVFSYNTTAMNSILISIYYITNNTSLTSFRIVSGI